MTTARRWTATLSLGGRERVMPLNDAEDMERVLRLVADGVKWQARQKRGCPALTLVVHASGEHCDHEHGGRN